MSGSSEPRTGDDAGFALIVVIWIAALLALLVLAFAQSARVHVRLGANALAQARAEASADSGLTLAALELLAVEDGDGRAPARTLSRTCRLSDGTALSYSISDAAGRVDLNVARPAVLRALLVGSGIAEADADRLVAAIEDFRDADETPRPGGAEARDYLAAGLAHIPKNASFETIDELGDVIGLGPGLLRSLRPHLTVHSGQDGVDPAAAGPELIAVLKSGHRPAGGLAATGSRDLPGALTSVSARKTAVLRAAAVTPQGGAAAREAVVSLRRQPGERAGSLTDARGRVLSRQRTSGARRSDVFVWEWRPHPIRGDERSVLTERAAWPEC